LKYDIDNRLAIFEIIKMQYKSRKTLEKTELVGRRPLRMTISEWNVGGM
jgi:hypothetical protein